MAASKGAVDAPFIPGGLRDALSSDYDPAVDFVPDINEKGYHVGLVRQPVRALVDPLTGEVKGFETIAAGEVDESDRPFGPTLDDLKQAHNREEKGWRAGKEFQLHAALAPTTIASETGRSSPATKARIAELEAEVANLRGGKTLDEGAASYRDLQTRAKELGLPAAGNAEELAASIAEAEAAGKQPDS